MKKVIPVFVAALVLQSVCSFAQDAQSEESQPISLELSGVGASTSYLWRGQELGGVNLQGSLEGCWEKGDFSASIGTWFIHCFQESIYGPFMAKGYQEWDFSVSAAYKGLSLTICDEMCGGVLGENGKYHYFTTGLNEEGHVVEGILSYCISDELPLTFTWSTAFLGKEPYEVVVEEGKEHRYYSSYFETSYDFNLGDFPVDFTASAGLIPWTSPYMDDVEGAHVSWLGLDAAYYVPVSSTFSLPASLSIGFNPTDASFLWSFGILF